MNQADKHAGQLSATLLCGGVAAVWLVAVAISRRSVPVVVAAALSTALGALIVGAALTSTTWHDSFCF
jgi:hypothetical protein